jgi:hypothetical protein
MIRPRHRPLKPTPRPQRVPPDWEADTWLNPLPVPEATEGGDSTWELWNEASRQLDAAFAPTQPMGVSVGSDASPTAARARSDGRLTADAVMLIARRNNRVCPQPSAWTRLYRQLEGDRYIDLQPPPVEDWIWSKLSALQKRLRFREHLEWAERHGKLPEVAAFVDSMAETDWLHMGEEM